MAATKFLARDLAIDVRTSTGPDVWTAIAGLRTLTHAPATERADTSDFDGNGRPTHLVAQRGDTWTLEGQALVDSANGDKDPGQDYVEGLARAFSTAAEGRFRITDPGGNRLEFTATAEVTLPGGGHNDAASWGAALEITGAVTYTPA